MTKKRNKFLENPSVWSRYRIRNLASSSVVVIQVHYFEFTNIQTLLTNILQYWSLLDIWIFSIFTIYLTASPSASDSAIPIPPVNFSHVFSSVFRSGSEYIEWQSHQLHIHSNTNKCNTLWEITKRSDRGTFYIWFLIHSGYIHVLEI